MLYIKINPIDRETYWNTSYLKISTLEANDQICQCLRIIGMLYIKIDPNNRETH